jgi:lysozyme
MRERYLPVVERAFAGFDLNEAQIAAALGFHWNTGAIASTSWVRMVKAGQGPGARQFLTTHYLNDGDLTARRRREAALFFDGKWPADLACPVYPVRKPGYAPNFGKGQRIDLLPILEGMVL